jgi:hypothetical protein
MVLGPSRRSNGTDGPASEQNPFSLGFFALAYEPHSELRSSVRHAEVDWLENAPADDTEARRAPAI